MAFTNAFSNGFSNGFAIAPSGPPPPDVPRQVSGGKGPVMRPVFDHILDARPGAVAQQIREIRSIDETLRKVTRNERELVDAGTR